MAERAERASGWASGGGGDGSGGGGGGDRSGGGGGGAHPPKFAFEACTRQLELPRQSDCTRDSDEPALHAPRANAPQLPVGVPYELKSIFEMYAPAGQVSVAKAFSATPSAQTVVVGTVHCTCATKLLVVP